MKKTEDEIFQELLEEKRHKELLKSLSNIANSLNSESDNEIIKSIKEQGQYVGKLVENVSSLQKNISDIQKDESINTDIKHKEFSIFLNKICQDIINSNNKLIFTIENRLLPDTFDLIKNNRGTTESVKVNYKPSIEIKTKN